jgi:tetratricopeptide (TPR) repeat protein
MRLDGQHLTLFVRPARAGDLPRVETLDIKFLETEGDDKPPTLTYQRSFEARSILDFKLDTRSVVFPAQIAADRLTLVRRTNVPTGAPEMTCFAACDQFTWLGASGDTIIGVYRRSDLFALQPGTEMSDEPLARAIPDAIAEHLGLQKDLKEPEHPVRPLEYALDPEGKRVLVLALARGAAVKAARTTPDPEAGGGPVGEKEDTEERPLYLATIDIKTGKLEGRVEKLKSSEDPALLLTADMVMSGAYRLRNDPKVTRYRVLLSFGPSQTSAFQVEAAEGDRDLRPGGRSGALREAGEVIQLERHEDTPDTARSWFPLSPGAGDAIDFGLLDDGKAAYVAYERGSVQIWELSAEGSKEVKSFDARMTLRKRRGRLPLAWSPNKKVIYLHDDTTIKAFDRSTGQLLRRTRPGSLVHQIVPLPNGELFAVVGSSTVVSKTPDAGYRILKKAEEREFDADALPLVAEALTMRWLGRSDPEIDKHWYLPRGAKTEESIPECAATGGGRAPSIALNCRRIHADRSLPAGLKALAISEYVYTGLTSAWPVRGAAPLALAMARAGEGEAVAFALMARQLGRTSTRFSSRGTQRDYPINDARSCKTPRLHAMRALFLESARKSRIVAPLHVALELQCDLGKSGRFDPIRKELEEAAAAGDALAIVFIGFDLELDAGNDPARLEPVLEHYAVAGKLLLAQRDNRLPQERLPDQQILEQIEDAIAWRRSRIVARLQTKDVARIWLAAADRTAELQKRLAESTATGTLPGGAWYHKTFKAWEGKDVIARVLRGEEELNKATENKDVRRISQLSLLAQFGFLHRDKDTPRSAYIDFLQRVGKPGVVYTSIFAEPVIEIHKLLAESERERGVGLTPLKKLAAHFAGISTHAMTPEERAKEYPILAGKAAKLGKPVLAGRLAIAALETSEDLPRNAANLTTLDNVQKLVLAIVKDADMFRQLDKEFAKLGWNYIGWATDRSPAARSADAAKVVRVVHEGAMLQERYTVAQSGMRSMHARSRLTNAYVNASLVATKAGNTDLAIADLTKAIEINPSYDFAYALRAEAHVTRRDYPRALADYEKAIEIDPGDASHHFARAKVLLETGKTELALIDANEAVTLRPGDSALFRTRGLIFERLGRTDEAAKDYMEAYARNPDVLSNRDAALRLRPLP